MIGTGRPRIYNTPEEMEQAGEEYFSSIAETEKPPTVAGLAIHLGFCDRQSMYDYEKRDGFSCVLKNFRCRIESHHEARLSGNSPTGSIFWLKNHSNYIDKQDLSHQNPDGTGLLSGLKITYVGKPDSSD